MSSAAKIAAVIFFGFFIKKNISFNLLQSAMMDAGFRVTFCGGVCSCYVLPLLICINVLVIIR
jgi:hypothetical protein